MRAEQPGLGLGETREPRVGRAEEALRDPEPPVAGRQTLVLLDIERMKQ